MVWIYKKVSTWRGEGAQFSLNQPEAYLFARAGMLGHPFKSVGLCLRALVAVPSEVAEKPLQTVLPVASLRRSQEGLAEEAARLEHLRATEPEGDRPIDATPEAIAILNSLHAAISEHLGSIALDNA